MTPAPLLRFRNVSRSFATPAGPVHVLHNVNLEIQPGEFLVVTGPSGSGKSTFLHLCALIDKPSAGEIFLEDKNIAAMSEHELCDLRKHHIGLVFQKFCLLPHRTARDNVMFRFRYIHDEHRHAMGKVEDVMRQMNIANIADRQARLLSSGEQQRVSIARAVVMPPLLLLADEPTGNLDSESADAVMQCFQELNTSGLTVIMVTHNETLLHYASRHVVCKDGQMNDGDKR